MQPLRITCIQSELIWQNISENLKIFKKKLSSLHGLTDLVVLPEMFTTGFSMDTSHAEEVNGQSVEWMQKMARQIDSAIIGSLMIKNDGSFYNRLVFAKSDGSIEFYDKRHLFAYGHEDKYFTAGRKRLEVTIKGWKICPLICYDLRFPVWARNTSEYDVLVYIANWPEARSYSWKTLLNARAIENQCYTIGVNRIGRDANGLNYLGDTLVFDFIGNKVLDMKDLEATETIELNREELKRFRTSFPFLADQDPFILQ